MKNRPQQKDSDHSKRIEEGSPAISKKRRRRKKQPFSIHALINSNSSSNITDYNPYLIKKKREFYKNAKCINKYKKTLKQPNKSQNILQTAAQHSEDGENNEAPNDRKMVMKKQKKNKNSLQGLRKEYEKKREEEENARVEREAIIQAKREEREKAEAQRKELRGKMFKRTQHGQPIMKYRIEHLLESIRRGAN
ncbi:rRNA-processing protein FYV7 [Magnolia sinica]|uniref:rRNA-processing protein FYV7 n=1 Tax=Magnolia sinica TaxID=86752 RepID=UPI002657F3B4|nr:rRNA-processing protein FYV7 [Magnolia sinica]